MTNGDGNTWKSALYRHRCHRVAGQASKSQNPIGPWIDFTVLGFSIFPNSSLPSMQYRGSRPWEVPWIPQKDFAVTEFNATMNARCILCDGRRLHRESFRLSISGLPANLIGHCRILVMLLTKRNTPSNNIKVIWSLSTDRYIKLKYWLGIKYYLQKST